MSMKNLNTIEQEKQGHSHAGHMWVMVVFCAVPIIGYVVIALLGISTPALGTLFLLICMIGMTAMMVMMSRDSHATEKNIPVIKLKKEANNETGE